MVESIGILFGKKSIRPRSYPALTQNLQTTFLLLSSLSNKNVVHGLLSVCTGMANVAFPIVVTEALLDRASHTASSYLPSRTSWVLQVG